MKNDYIINLVKDPVLKQDFYEAVALLNEYGLQPGRIRAITCSTRMRRALGKVIVIKGTSRYEETGSRKPWEMWEFEIRLNAEIAKPEFGKDRRMNTIIHELLHTCKGCMNHTDLWLRYARMISAQTPYTIERVAHIPEEVFKPKQEENKYMICCQNPDCDFKTYRKCSCTVRKQATENKR